jgi:hypothetical protein
MKRHRQHGRLCPLSAITESPNDRGRSISGPQVGSTAPLVDRHRDANRQTTAATERRLPVAGLVVTDRVHAARRVVEPIHHGRHQHAADCRISIRNAPSSAGASVTMVLLQSGVG